MDESIKNRIILALVILVAIFFIAAVNSCASASRQKYARDKEMSTRLDLEEKMNKVAQEKAALEAALAEEKKTHQATKKELAEEQLVNQSIKEELHKVTKLKETLEDDLKDALVQSKSAKSRK